MRSGLKWWIIAQKAIPFLQEVVKLVILMALCWEVTCCAQLSRSELAELADITTLVCK